MKTFIFYADINASWFVEQFSQWVNILNDEEQQRFSLMKNKVKQKQLVLSRCLIHQALLTLEYSLDDGYQIVNYNRLFLPNVEQPFSLSISHSGNIAAIILSEKSLAVGIDVEQLKLRQFTELAQEFCTPEEMSHLATSQNNQEEFYQLWTAKEALAKACSLPLFECYRCNCTSVLLNEQGVIYWQGEWYYFNRFECQNILGILMANNEQAVQTELLQFHG